MGADAGNDRSSAAQYGAKIGAVLGLMVAASDLLGWRGQVLQPWATSGGIAENAGYFLGATFAGAIGLALVGAAIDFFRNIRGATWKTAGKVALWALGGLILLVWSLAHWQSAQWVIGISAGLWGIGHFSQEYESRKEIERRALHDRLERQSQMMAEILDRLRRIDRDRGYQAD